MQGVSGSTSAFRIELLGHFRVTEKGAHKRPIRIRSRRGQALITLLALQPDRAIPRAKAAALLWEDQSEPRARHSLRQLLTELRNELGPVFDIGSKKDALTLDSATFESDVQEFLRNTSASDPAKTKSAAELYAGELFDPGPVSSSYDELIATERRKLHSLALKVLESSIDALIVNGNDREALEHCERLFALDSLHEATHRRIISLEAKINGINSATRRAKELTALLKTELGVSPDRETSELIALLAKDQQTPSILDTFETKSLPQRSRLALAGGATLACLALLSAILAGWFGTKSSEKSGRYDEALYQGFTEITKYHSLPSTDDDQPAYSHFRKALKMKPDSAAAKVGIARILLQRIYESRAENFEQDLARAETMLSEAVAEAPFYVPGLAALGSLRKYQGRSEEAAALFEKAIQLNPMAAGAHANLGHILVFLGRPEEAERHIRKAIEYSPNDQHLASWLVFAGEADMHLERYESAIRWLEKSIEVNPKITAGLTLLAAAQVLTGEDTKAAGTAHKLKQMSYDFQKIKSRVQYAIDRRVRIKANPEVALRRVKIEAAMKRAFELAEVASR